jgi:hypothetical protein
MLVSSCSRAVDHAVVAGVVGCCLRRASASASAAPRRAPSATALSPAARAARTPAAAPLPPGLVFRGVSLPEAMAPRKRPDGGWRAPELQARAIARLKKQASFGCCHRPLFSFIYVLVFVLAAVVTTLFPVR